MKYPPQDTVDILFPVIYFIIQISDQNQKSSERYEKVGYDISGIVPKGGIKFEKYQDIVSYRVVE